jgi:hypothetical protein
MGWRLHLDYPALRPNVAVVVLMAEGGNSLGISNPLNIENAPWEAQYHGHYGANGFEQFPDWQHGELAAAALIPYLMHLDAEQSDLQQIAVWAESAWCASHYARDGVVGGLLYLLYHEYFAKPT